MVEIRIEEVRDFAQVFELNKSAFAGNEEAELVENMRGIDPYFALVAESDGRVIGHIAFSEVTLNGTRSNFLGLAPMAVLPDFQNQKVGTMLVHKGLEWMMDEGFTAIFLIGHPNYYPRFGFKPAGPFGFTCEFPAPDDAFLVFELKDGALNGSEGLIEYNQAFKGL